MNLTTTEWTAIIAVCGIMAQLLIAYLTRRQIAKQLDLQQLVSHRTTAAFVADKRQKWIDELRTDMAFYLALSQEIVWKWDVVRSLVKTRTKEEAVNAVEKLDPAKVSKILQDAAEAFSSENGARDREHHERHVRIMFRLNPKKDSHIKLRECLDSIRLMFGKIQNANTESEASILVDGALRLIEEAQKFTEDILKAEWQRVKQEVAYPEVLISTISSPPSPSGVGASALKANTSFRTTGVSIADRISFGNFLVAIATMVIALSAYFINSRLADVQAQSHSHQVAEFHQKFWQEIANLEKSALDLSSSLGEAIADVAITLEAFLSELPSSFPENSSERQIFMVDHPRLTAKWLKYVAAHGNMIAAVEAAGVDYDNSILKYGTVASELNIAGWSDYSQQQHRIAEWKSELMAPHKRIFSLVTAIVNEQRIPAELEDELIVFGTALGRSGQKLAPPHLEGLIKFKSINIHP